MPKRSTANSATIPPPVLGWNTRDPISNMDPQYATELLNFFPNAGTVDLRKGYRQHGTGLGAGAVYSLAEYTQENGTTFLLGFSAGQCWNATSAGAAVDITNGQSLIGNTINYVNHRGLIFLKEFEGTDVYVWDGTMPGLTLANFVGPGGDDKLLSKITTYRNRIYFAGLGTASIWYSAKDAITGALTEFPLLSLFRLGGYVSFIGTTTLGGDLIQELFVVISNKGEILLYQGDYPGGSTWSIIGRYYIPAPIAPNSFFYWGQDVVAITTQGLVKLSDVINTGPSDKILFVTDSIAPSFRSYISAGMAVGSVNLNTFSGLVYPNGQYLLINAPATTTTYVQFVMNINTGAWCRFSGQNGYNFGLFNNNLYFGGGSGKVFRADYGNYDEDPATPATPLGRSIKLKTAYNYFGDRSGYKQFTQATPLIYMDQGLELVLGVDVDYDNIQPTSTITLTGDSTYKLYRPKMGLTGIGKCGAIRIDQTVYEKQISLQAIEVVWNDGDI